MRLLPILISVSLLFSCNNDPSNQHGVQLKKSKPVRVDTIRINKTLLLNVPQVSVLRDGLYHDGEIDPLLSHRSWKGLFTSGHQSYIADADVKIIRSFDDMTDQPGEQSGMLVKVDHKDTSVLLISGIALKNSMVKQQPLSHSQILPGEKLNFQYNNKAYRIYATGKKQIIDSVSKAYNVTSYKLFVETTQSQHHYIQVLVDIPRYEGPFHTVIKFVGDIDNDGVPDFIIDTSSYYGSENSTLFLSRPSKNNVLYTIVGEITGTA